MGDVVATLADALIAVPLAAFVYCLGIPCLAVGVGIVRGLQELSEYVNGRRGHLRIAIGPEQRQLEAHREPVAEWRDVAHPGVHGE